jgi:pSer/pThr/pTyr-binding forkhead associated (FHA) protein
MPVPRVIILSEILRGQTFELTNDIYTIGRTENRDICIPDGTISSHHAELVRQDDGTYIARDMGSTNGTRVNGAKIAEHPLCNSDILQVGGIEILFDCEDKTSAVSLNTQTGIDLSTTSGSMDMDAMSNVSPFEQSRGGEGGKSKVVFRLVIGVLVVLVVALVGMLVMKLTGKQ